MWNCKLLQERTERKCDTSLGNDTKIAGNQSKNRLIMHSKQNTQQNNLWNKKIYYKLYPR